MSRLKIGVRLNCMGLPLRSALLETAKMGVQGVTFDAVGDLSARTLTQTGIREIRNLLRTHDVELVALGCPMRRGLDVFEDLQPRIDHVKNTMSLCYDLGARVVVVQAGQIPEKAEDFQEGRGLWLRESLTALGHHGDRIGVTLALETGLEPGERLCNFLQGIDTAGLGVNLDPANMLMQGFDPYQAVRLLREKIVHVDAKDVRRAAAGRMVQEVPLGHGDIDWMQFLAILEEVEYFRWITVERESGNNPLAEMRFGVEFLRKFVR